MRRDDRKNGADKQRIPHVEFNVLAIQHHVARAVIAAVGFHKTDFIGAWREAQRVSTGVEGGDGTDDAARLERLHR